jgi:hypothetical protein
MSTNSFIINTNEIRVDKKQFQKMLFIMNALDQGWKIRKKSKYEDKFMFIKRHEGKKEIFLESYLERFIESNIDVGILNKFNVKSPDA